jgi:hypothetical protein
MSGGDWPVVFSTGDQVEAEVVRGLLESSGIPVIAVRHGLKRFEPWLGATASGSIDLKVPPDRAEEAREILAAPPQDEEEHR